MTDYTSPTGVVYSVTSAFLGNNVKITDPDGTVPFNGFVSNLLGGVVTGDGFDLSIASALVGGTYVVVPGVSGTIDILVSLGTVFPNTFYIGGTADINVLASALSGVTLNVDGGDATLSNGTVLGALNGATVNITNGGTFSSGGALATVLNGTTINFGTGGGTLVANAGGSILNLASTTINNYDPTKDTIEFENTSAVVSGYTVSGSGASRTVTLFDTNGNQIGTYTANLADGATLPTGTYNALSGENNPLSITYSDGNIFIGVCFLAGSMIRTPAGEVAVETLRVGDLVTAFVDGQEVERAVTWAGYTQAVVRPGLPDDEAGYPVRVVKDALAAGVPHKDLLITPEHCLFLDGVFVPVRMLVNGRSIAYDRSFTAYEYFHIETDGHAVIMADGALTESYLDTGNRGVFKQQGNVVSIGRRTVRSWETDAAAALAVDRATVEPLYRRIADRAEAAGIGAPVSAPVLTADADLSLVTDRGQVIRKARDADGKVLFMLPPGVESVRLVSRTSRPCDVAGPFVDDRRGLGVLVGEMTLFDTGLTRAIDAHLTADAVEGWHGLEQEGAVSRWTAGNAIIPLGGRQPNSIGMLSVQILSAGPYLVREENVSDAAKIA